jgi:hypothetical protein
MKLRLFNPNRAQKGYVIALVLIFLTLSFLVLMSALGWCRSNSEFNERNNQYFRTVAAAEAATEKVLANLSRDYQASGETVVYGKLGTYRGMTPTTSESGLWNDFTFTDPQNNLSQIYVDRITTAAYIPLESQYQGIYGLASTYRVVSNAKLNASRFGIGAALRQDVQLATIPVFQFAIFYSIDLEINPGPAMKVTGRVHSNSKIYMQPENTLTFQSHVTAADAIIHNKSPDDPQSRNTNNSKIVFQAEHDANVNTLNLPIGTNNTPESVRSILDIPPSTESATSQMGQQRYYNQADMVIVVSNSSVKVTSGSSDNFSTTIPYCEWTNFFSTNVTFYNKREGKTVKASQVNVGKLKDWASSGTNSLSSTLTHDFDSVYVADMRTTNSTTETGVYVVNGQTLPTAGLTVATPNPIYVKGNYNVANSALGTTNTVNSKPASLVGDAITILSTAWQDTASSNNISSRVAGDTTVNAALLGGIVKSGGGDYSGGVENFPRFLENWSNKTLTYNGSMVVMYYSRYATAHWGDDDVYSPPSRNWAFDLNFLDPAKLPPCTPQLRVLVRAQWAITKPGSTL